MGRFVSPGDVLAEAVEGAGDVDPGRDAAADQLLALVAAYHHGLAVALRARRTGSVVGEELDQLLALVAGELGPGRLHHRGFAFLVIFDPAAFAQPGEAFVDLIAQLLRQPGL